MARPEPAAPAGEHASAATEPLTAAELADRLRLAIGTSFAMYASVESQMFGPRVEVCMLPPGPTPDDAPWIPLDRTQPRDPHLPTMATVVARLIPDIGITGTATARPGEVVLGDFTLTGTLPDGWLLHLHTEFTCHLDRGLVTRYVVKNDPDEFQRYVVALGNPYAGRGFPAAEARSPE